MKKAIVLYLFSNLLLANENLIGKWDPVFDPSDFSGGSYNSFVIDHCTDSDRTVLLSIMGEVVSENGCLRVDIIKEDAEPIYLIDRVNSMDMVDLEYDYVANYQKEVSDDSTNYCNTNVPDDLSFQYLNNGRLMVAFDYQCYGVVMKEYLKK